MFQFGIFKPDKPLCISGFEKEKKSIQPEYQNYSFVTCCKLFVSSLIKLKNVLLEKKTHCTITPLSVVRS